VGNRLSRQISASEENKLKPTPFSYTSLVPQTPRHEQHSTESRLDLAKKQACAICHRLTVNSVCPEHGRTVTILASLVAGGEN
jgi:hypothetical protein